MTTNNFEGNATDFGLPSELKLELVANQLLSDINGSLFEPEVCSEGIEKLVTSGDTGVFDIAANKGNQYTGYAPQVISQKQADSDSKIEARTTANDNNVIPAKDNYGVNHNTVGGQKNNSQMVIGTKTLEQIRQDFPILQEK